MSSDIPVTRADTGLGTTYERWALNRLLLQLQQRYRFESVLEAPDDGMTGIAGLNSLALARAGAQVTVVLPHAEQVALARQIWARYGAPGDLRHLPHDGKGITPETPLGCGAARLKGFGNGSYDLVWNFNVINRVSDSNETLEEMVRISRRYVLLGVPNAANYSFWLHRLHHRVAGDAWDHGPVSLLRARPWIERLEALGLAVCESFFVDVPWWPDIVNPAQLIADFFPPLKSLADRKASPENRYLWLPDNLPYWEPERYPEVHARMERLSYFERSPIRAVRALFAHHVGILAERATT